MSSQGALGRHGPSRTAMYVALAIAAIIPVLAFAVGPLTDQSIGLRGPGGPLLAFSAGVLSFVSPCVLPIVPIYITHLSGASIEHGRITADRRVTFMHAVAFVVGLTAVFMVLGVSVGLLGSYFFKDNQRELERVAGVVIALMGVIMIPAYGRSSPMRAGLLLLGLTALFFFIAQVADLRAGDGQPADREGLIFLGGVLLLAWLRFSGYIQLPIFQRTFSVDVGKHRQVGYTRSALVGGAFALGWTPCIGPVLGTILTLGLSSSEALTSTYLLAAYSAGFSVPFLITGLAFSDVTRFMRKIQRYSPVIEVAAAVMLVSLGLLLWFGRISGLNDYFGFAGFNQGL
ncbi:MAG: cytochrome c biogenesis protein CcdA [Dehalococcoidia bacterium]|nr:cytochrome c biogenesis protein CcdA [Dehalococcoidia bacterium]